MGDCLSNCCHCFKSGKQLNPYKNDNKKTGFQYSEGANVSKASSWFTSVENPIIQAYLPTSAATGSVNNAYQFETINEMTKTEAPKNTTQETRFPDGDYVYKLQPSVLKAIAKHLNQSKTRIDDDDQDDHGRDEYNKSDPNNTTAGNKNENDESNVSRIIRDESFKVVYDYNASF